MGAPAIDVLVPIYNAADTLDESFASLAAQTFADFRVLAIDDGSTDGSAAKLAAWSRRDPRFVTITQANGGIVAALNRGLAEVTSEYVARLDGDDIALPGRFAAQHAYLVAHPDCVAVGCAIEHIDQAGRPIAGLPHPAPPEFADMTSIPAREPYIVHPFLMARSDALRAIGGYRRVPHSEDSDLFWRLAEIGRLHNLTDLLGRYRMHLGSISGSSIVNGRIMAIGSQLGAVSARRRRVGRPDLAFDGDLIADLRDAGTLEAMCAVAAPMLSADEQARFRLASGIKLLELAAYRPYEIDAGDCAFIAGEVGASAGSCPARDRGDIAWYLSRTGGRLARQGRWRDMMALVPPRLWPKALAKGLLGY